MEESKIEYNFSEINHARPKGEPASAFRSDPGKMGREMCAVGP